MKGDKRSVVEQVRLFQKGLKLGIITADEVMQSVRNGLSNSYWTAEEARDILFLAFCS